MKELSDKDRCSMIKEERGNLFRDVTERVSMLDLHWQILTVAKGWSGRMGG